MKKTVSLLLLALLLFYELNAQDTFSIVALDSASREVGSAGASCVDLFAAGITDASFLGDLLPNLGAINTQASYLATNQNNARTRMLAGDTPAQIIAWLIANDAQNNPTVRQYGIVGFTGLIPSSAAYTGSNCTNYKNHKTGKINGIYYSIQGNILLGQLVIDSIEARFRREPGDLACKLMAGLQGGKIIGADTRCASNGTSTLFAFVKVSQPTDPYGSPSLMVRVRTRNNYHIEPIDSLQKLFNLVHSCPPLIVKETITDKKFLLFPNPAGSMIYLKTTESFVGADYLVIDQLGRKLLFGKLSAITSSIDIQQLKSGVYFIQIGNMYWERFFKN
jgi:uncharacterized Ntn-hydrolase superfamily protein